MYTLFINSRKSEISDPHRILLNLADRINLKNMLLYQILAFTMH